MARRGNCIAVLGALFLTISASAFISTGSSRATPTPTPTCPSRMLKLPVSGSAPSTASLVGLGSRLRCLEDGVSSRWMLTAKSRSRTCRTTLLFARPKPSDSSDNDDDSSSTPRGRGRPKISDEEREERKKQLRILLGATRPEIDELLRNYSKVLYRRDIVGCHGPKVSLLQERLGISKKAAGRLFVGGGKGALGLKLETLESKIDWFQARLVLSKSDLRKVIKYAPILLSNSIEDNLEPSLEIIQSSLELSDKELTKMVVKTPDLLLHDLTTERLAVRLSYLRGLLNIEENDLERLQKVILKRPGILLYPEDRMTEIQHWMKNRFGLGDARIAQMCRNVPQLLTANIETLEEKAGWLQKELNLHDKELSKMLSTETNLLTLSVEKKMKPKLAYLRQSYHLGDEELKDLLLRCPMIFKYSIENNLEPKLQFYSGLVGKAVAREAMLEQPSCLVKSLKGRLEPRLAEIEDRGEKVRWSKTLLFRLALRTPGQWEAHGLGEAPQGRPARRAKNNGKKS